MADRGPVAAYFVAVALMLRRGVPVAEIPEAPVEVDHLPLRARFRSGRRPGCRAWRVSGHRRRRRCRGAGAGAGGTDDAFLRIEVSSPREVTGAYRSDDDATGKQINALTGKPRGAEDRGGLDNGIRFGGALPWEGGMLSFSTRAKAKSWRVEPSLDTIEAVMKEIGDPQKAVLCICFRQPYALDDASGVNNAGGLVATFGVSDEALMDVLTGRAKPQGKLPFALARSLAAIEANDPDAPGYPAKDTLYPFGFGLGYCTARRWSARTATIPSAFTRINSQGF